MLRGIFTTVWNVFLIWVVLNLGFHFIIELLGYTSVAEFQADQTDVLQGDALLTLLDFTVGLILNTAFVEIIIQPVAWILSPIVNQLPPDLAYYFPQSPAEDFFITIANTIANLPVLNVFPLFSELDRNPVLNYLRGTINWIYLMTLTLFLLLDIPIRQFIFKLSGQMGRLENWFNKKQLERGHKLTVKKNQQYRNNLEKTRQQKERPVEKRGEIRELLDDFREEIYTLERKNTDANRDDLTGLLNRKAFNKEFTSYFKNAKNNANNFALAILDIDNFKALNDTYGHDFGDLVLSHVGQTIALVIDGASHKIKAYRYGGEELVLIFSDSSLDSSKKIIETIREKINKGISE